MKKIIFQMIVILAAVLIAGSASAVPMLQTYITGSDYYANYSPIDEDSWVITSNDFELKVVGYWKTLPEPDLYLGESLDMAVTPLEYDYMDVFVVVNTPTGQSGTIWRKPRHARDGTLF